MPMQRNAGYSLLILFLSRYLVAETPVEPFLQNLVRLSAPELSSLDQGKPITRILEPAQGTELPAFGMIRIRVPRDFFLEKLRAIESYKKSKEILQIGKFHSPPRPEDLSSLTLDTSDLSALKRCTVGDCNLKLSAEIIGRFRREVSWSSPDSGQQANALYRQMLFDYVMRYLKDGNSALPAYSDKGSPVSPADEFLSVLKEAPEVSGFVPEFRDYLAQYPRLHLDNVEDFIYWSKESFGFKSVVSITHMVLYTPKRDGAALAVIASKQVYANHYFVASLGLSVFMEPRPLTGAGSWLIYINRSHIDLPPPGMFGGLLRYFVKRRVLDGLDKHLRVLKQRLESAYLP